MPPQQSMSCAAKMRLLKKRPFMPYKPLSSGSTSASVSVSTEASEETARAGNASKRQKTVASGCGCISSKDTSRVKKTPFSPEERAQRKLESNRRSALRKREEYEHEMNRLRIEYVRMQTSNKKLKDENQELAVMIKALRDHKARQEATRLQEEAWRQMQTKPIDGGLVNLVRNPLLAAAISQQLSTSVIGSMATMQPSTPSPYLHKAQTLNSSPATSHTLIAADTRSQHAVLGLLSKLLAPHRG